MPFLAVGFYLVVFLSLLVGSLLAVPFVHRLMVKVF
jgi:hypothetical protein